ncbi:MAG TPA: carbonic anhydrase [Rhizomicrobium sp.]|nr:carbonic anhydrase [Rhizomicrobium sp.]
MFGRKHKVAVALTCADWRLHHSRIDFNRRIARLVKVDGADLIAVPGPDGLIKPERDAEWQVALGQIKLLIGAHRPDSLVVVAHQRCAGHPVSDGEHETDVAATARKLKEETGFAGPVVAAVAVYHSDKKWDLKKIGSV